MKRIVIDARESGTTSGRYVDKLIEYLHKLQPNYEITLLAKAHRLDFLRSIAPTFRVDECNIKEFTFAEQFRFKRQIQQLRPDLVFFPFVHQPIFYRGKVVTMMQDLTAVRFRNPSKNWLIFTFKREVYKWVNRIAAHKSAALLTPTKFVQHDVAQFCRVNPSKITVTLESADKITEPAQAYSPLSGQPFIMYVGRPQPHKNLDRLCDAFAIVKQTHPQLKLVLVGKTDALFDQLKQRVAAKQITNVVFTGFVPDAQLRWLYEHALAYVFPSLSEGFGLPGLEAMHYNLPLVSSNATCSPEVYQSAALYFDPLDPADMATKINQVLDNPKQAKQLAQAGAKLVRQYSWQRMAQQTLAIFDRVLSDTTG